MEKMSMNERIAVTLEGHEGGIHIDGLSGAVLTKADERPEWAEGYAVGLLAERQGWYEKRLGAQLPDTMTKPQTIDARDLGWVAFDAAGDEVEVEADGEFRMDALSTFLNIDKDSGEMARVLVSAEAAETYQTQPTSEATLEEVEGKSFEEVRRAVNG